jgi:bifunctional DNA-binding transcriptional regulator/antitoxin component of YhaV-PrlF toxin-antitoxin module
MLLRLDSKRRLTLPASLVPWKPGDYVEVTYIKSEDAFVARRIKSKDNAGKVLEKFKSARKKAKTK